MVDVPIYVAIITAGTGIIAAAVPQFAAVIRDRRAERDRRERSSARIREACIALLSAAEELRTLAENLIGYRGDPDGTRERVAEARRLAKATRLHAADVSMQVRELIEPASEVAGAVTVLADDVVSKTDLDEGVVISPPDVTKLVECIAAFREAAVRYANG
jgi:hypothetical protein